MTDPTDRPGDAEPSLDDLRDELPEDLDAAGFVGIVEFPDNARRRITGAVYLGVAAVCALLWLALDGDSVIVNDGFAWVAVVLAAFGGYSILAGRSIATDEGQALEAATRAVGFPVGHASAQLAWRGLLSVPTWRILLYSADDPPSRRGLVLVDATDLSIVGTLHEENPEDWADTSSSSSSSS